jgi:cytochrome c-type biogenesis protein CcmF
MIAQFGYGVLVISFLTALFAISAAVYGYFKPSQRWVESARNAMMLSFPLITLSALTLIYLIVNNHFELDFVYSVTSRSMPTYLKVTALWGGQAGSLLFWSWLMSAFASAVMLRKWNRDREFLPWVIVVSSVTLAFFLALVIFYENPFARYWQTFDGNVVTAMFQPQGSVPFAPADGRGLNPLLRHPGMIIHPPMLYLGFVSFVIPFAFAIAALVTGRTDDRWIRITRRWTLVAWTFLSLGLLLGGRWAYDVLGWGGYWGWDPVEIAAFMPWLTGTAFAHSVMIQEKRGMFKHWNTLLIILTYSLVIIGTFLTRSGVLSSVHAFAQSAIGPAFFIFMAVTFIVSISLLIYRWNDLKAESELKSVFSREAFFLLNNLFFMSILVVCFWGVFFPLISELFTGQKVTVGPPFYERATAPLFAALIFLMGIAPLSAWGHSTVKTLGRALWKPALAALVITVVIMLTYTRNWIALVGFYLIALVLLVTLNEFWRGARARQKTQEENPFTALARLIGRNRRRYGGYIIHISMMLMAIGILGIELFQVETQDTIQIGESLKLQGYQLVYKDIAQWDDPSTSVNHTRAVVEVYKGDRLLTELHPRTDYYYEAQQNMTIPGLLPSLTDDVYLLLVNWEPASSAGTTFKLYVNPLVNWLWIAIPIFLIGILIAVWPDKDPEYESARERARISRQTSAAD